MLGNTSMHRKTIRHERSLFPIAALGKFSSSLQFLLVLGLVARDYETAEFEFFLFSELSKAQKLLRCKCKLVVMCNWKICFAILLITWKTSEVSNFDRNYKINWNVTLHLVVLEMAFLWLFWKYFSSETTKTWKHLLQPTQFLSHASEIILRSR